MARLLRVVRVIWYRELLRYVRDRSRIVGSLATPVLFLVIFGGGLSPAMGNLAGGLSGGRVEFINFMYPGVIGMTVLFTSIFSGASLVWDREFGFLKEVLVAPIGRSSVALGKTLGGATVAVLQGSLMLALAPFLGVSLGPGLVLRILPVLFLTAFSLTSLGVLIGVRMKSMQGFQVIMNFLTLPMFLLSGAFFPLRDLPSWLAVLVHLNPFTYAVDALRQTVFRSMGLPQAVLGSLAELGLGVRVAGVPLSVANDMAIVSAFAAVMLSAAVWSFRRAE